MQRLVNNIISKGFIGILCLWSLFFICSACAGDDRRPADELNDIAYSYHYRSLDSVKVYADSVLSLPSISDDAHAEALNNLAFFYIRKMQYAKADSILHEIHDITDNYIELAISDIQQMQLCQRLSLNKAFYEYRKEAQNELSRLKEENHYTPRQTRRIIYAEAEMNLVSSVYEYYVGKTDEAVNHLYALDSMAVSKQDTALYVAYLYNIGAGGVLTNGTKQQILHTEYDCLMQCYTLAAEQCLVYWQANAMQAIAEHILSDGGQYIRENNFTSQLVNAENVADSLVAGNLTERALALFSEYGDIYQQAATWRTLSICYRDLNDYPGAVYALQQALKVDTSLVKAPALMASLYEQFSIAFSALDNKSESDYYRNLYLDLYDNTRQDRQLEARAEQLDQQTTRLRHLIYIIISFIFLLLFLLFYLVWRRRKLLSSGKETPHSTLSRMQDAHRQFVEKLDDEIEELQEDCFVKRMQISRQQQFYVEQRAKMHLINSISPLIDRLLHEIRCLSQRAETDMQRSDRKQYINELLQDINAQNDFLTRWIQLKQGELALRIQSFPLQQLFDIIAAGSSNYTRQQQTLVVASTDETVKADKTLTLFMLNTLCDNARKFTPVNGTITVFATSLDDEMVEISVADTGKGISDDEKARLFEAKPVTDEQLHTASASAQQARASLVVSNSHGFGLLNCKGIIEKYKKTNSLFSRAAIGVESEEGKGARFFFRLPRGIRRTLLLAITLTLSATMACAAQPNAPKQTVSASKAHETSRPTDIINFQPSQNTDVVAVSPDSFAAVPAIHSLAYVEALSDSIYNCNLQARYSDAIIYARHCLHQINLHYSDILTSAHDTLQLYDTFAAVPAEVVWIRDTIQAPYKTILSLRNEVAVAALALHQWDLYAYNNSAYSQLFKEYSADNTLAKYCSDMEKAEYDNYIAIVILIILVLSLIPIYYFAYYRFVILDVSATLAKIKQETAEHEQTKRQLTQQRDHLNFEHDRLHVTNNVISNSFSTLKHETMYYPSRILQLLNHEDYEDINDVATYYRTLYTMLSAQAQYNCSLQLSPSALRHILMQTMERLSGLKQRDIEATATTDAQYKIYRFSIAAPLPDGKPADTRIINIHILTQVARDLGELYNLRRCGIVQDADNITVTVPL